MSQLLRGIAWRKGQAVALFFLGVVVVAGCLVAAQFSALTDTPPGSIGVLLLLGVVALSVQAAGAARSRRPEIAIAQIRGRNGVRLFAYFLTEPVTILVVATAAGVGLGRLVTKVAAEHWLDTSGTNVGRIDALGWTTVGLALGASIAAVVAGSWRTLREPLVEQLDASHRPRQAGTFVLFGQTVVVVAAAIAGFQASQNAGSRDGWAGIVNPALLSPILLGLAAGQLAAWGLQAAASVSARRSREARSIGPFLAVRRMARRADTVFGARLVIAAAVVAAVTASATTAVASWQDESTRLALGGPRQFAVADGGLAAYLASHRADPDGRWLMAMVAVPDGSERYRRMFADTARWDAVVGDFLGSTAAGGVSRDVASLQVGKQVLAPAANTASVTFTNRSLHDTSNAKLTLVFAAPDGSVVPVVFDPDRPDSVSDTSTTVAEQLPGCQDGCVINQLQVEGEGRKRNGVEPFVVVTAVEVAGRPILEQSRWSIPPDERASSAQQRQGSLRVRVHWYGDIATFKPVAAQQRLAVLATPGLDLQTTRASAISYSVDGGAHNVDVVGEVTALPFVGRRGALLDLSRGLAGGGTTTADARAFIVARTDTPRSVLDALDATGVTSGTRTFDASLADARRRPTVQGVRLYILMSVFAALIAVVGLAAAVTGQRDERRREAASLRVTGVRARHIKAAHRREAMWLSLGAAVAVAVAGWVAARLTLDGLALVPQTVYSPVLQASPDLGTVLLVALGAGVLVGVITLGANRRIARSSPPSLLRDDVG